MLKGRNEWDVRCPADLKTMFPRPRRGYWYKVSRTQARLIVAYLAAEYGCVIPHIREMSPPSGWNGGYWFHTREIAIHSRGHIKTVFHEFYHHLDNETGGLYNSDDWPLDGGLSLAWRFADLMFNKMREP